ncbi:MAG: hypothetical protein ABSF64_23375 [Bryobacteraceae bacterium]|jgi:hypothetical protein
MKAQPKSPFAQLNLPLLNPAPVALPAGKDHQLVEAPIELPLRAAAPHAGKGESHDPQADR